jgi:FkbM family methyltransferase
VPNRDAATSRIIFKFTSLLRAMLRRLAYGLISYLPPRLVRRVARWFFGGPLRHWFLKQVSGLVRENEVTIKHGQLAGFRFTASGSNPGYLLGASEPPVQDAISRHLRPGMVFYDIGANVGFFTLIGAKAVGPTGQVYAFEPVPESAHVLRRNLALNGVENVCILELAVSGASGEGWMKFDADLARAALSSAASGGGLRVPVTSLDDAVERSGLRPPDLIKIDVEGGETGVIRGMQKILACFQPIVLCEVHRRADVQHKREVTSLFQEHGYNVADLEPELGGMPHVLATSPRRVSSLRAR